METMKQEYSQDDGPYRLRKRQKSDIRYVHVIFMTYAAFADGLCGLGSVSFDCYHYIQIISLSDYVV